jgi:hypothetical protein
MTYTEKEYELAMRYVNGDINDVQLNYLAVQGKTTEKRVREIAEYVNFVSPFLIASGLILAFLAFHLVFCFLCVVFNFK